MEAPSSSRFALPISDELEELQEDRRGTTIPCKTKAATAWGVGIFSDSASKRILKLYLSREFAVWRPHCWEQNERTGHRSTEALFKYKHTSHQSPVTFSYQ